MCIQCVSCVYTLYILYVLCIYVYYTRHALHLERRQATSVARETPEHAMHMWQSVFLQASFPTGDATLQVAAPNQCGSIV